MIRKTPFPEKSEFFANVPPAIREAVLSTARCKTYACRNLMFRIDDPIEETLLLVEGCAKVSQLTRSGAEVVLRISIPGELVGELGMEPGRRHSSSAQAMEECVVLAWMTQTFESSLERFPILRRNVNSILERRIIEMESRVCRISAGQLVSQRLAHDLCCLGSSMGRKVNGHIEIKIAQETLAQMTAMGAYTLNRILSSWQNQGLLKVYRKCIAIHDPLGLSALGGLSGHQAPSSGALEVMGPNGTERVQP